MEIPGGELKGTSKTDVFDVPFVFNMPSSPIYKSFPSRQTFLRLLQTEHYSDYRKAKVVSEYAIVYAV